MNILGVILAAGKGVRMRSRIPKVLHPVAGVPMVKHVMNAARSAGVRDLVLVVGYGRGQVMELIQDRDTSFVVQSEQLGTGHALAQAETAADKADTILVLCGDTPLLQPETLINLLEYHKAKNAAATVLTAYLENPTGYGRVVRDQNGAFLRIVEEKDASEQEKRINEINSGIYCFDLQVFTMLRSLTPDNAQGEYYLTDVLIEYQNRGMEVHILAAATEQDVYGINDRVQLAQAERIIRRRKNEELMLAGVTIIDPDSTYVDLNVTVGQDTIIYPNTMIEGSSAIGSDCRIGPNAVVIDTRIGDKVKIDSSKIVESIIGDECVVGPFAYIRPGTVVAERVKIGDFVEVKKSIIGPDSKIPHLSYVGDATIGNGVNIGAGTITCNYDGENKYPTVIEDGAFIGSNTNLVAPVTIKKGAVTGAGSTITRDLPSFSLGVERAQQRIIENWANRKKEKHK